MEGGSSVSSTDTIVGLTWQKISRINAKLKATVGENLAEYYIIKRDPEDEKYKINLDRTLITYKQ